MTVFMENIVKRYGDLLALGFVGLDRFRDLKPSVLFGGIRCRLNLACGIAHQPDLIILDEPTVAVDSQSRNHILPGIQAMDQVSWYMVTMVCIGLAYYALTSLVFRYRAANRDP